MGKFLTLLGSLFSTGKKIRAPLIGISIAAWILSSCDAVIEIYQQLGLEFIHPDSHLRSPTWAAISALAATSILTGHITFILIGRVHFSAARAVAAIVTAALPLSVSLGLSRAGEKTMLAHPSPYISTGVDFSQTYELSSALAAATIIVCVGGLGLALLYYELCGRAKFDAFNRRVSVLACIVVLSFTGWLASTPIALLELLGPIAILLIWVTFVVYFSSVITKIFDPMHVPALSIAIGAAFLFSIYNLNNNHVVKPSPIPPKEIPNLDVFDKWLDARADKDHFAQGRYPVIIVSAAGGGLYAALHTATVLARLQDACPNFSQHVFAISTVSGGSLGAATFTSLSKLPDLNRKWVGCKFGVRPKGPNEERVQKFLDHDFLTPILANALFPDFLQRFIPFPLFTIDRAGAFEASLNAVWKLSEGSVPSPFDQPLLNTWSIEGGTPALFLNAVKANTGNRLIMSPISLYQFPVDTADLIRARSAIDYLYAFLPGTKKSDRTDFLTYRSYTATQDFTLAQAVSMSSRFPWIAPAASVNLRYPTLDDRDSNLYQSKIVDGGYFENSGTETAIDIINKLGTTKNIRLILLAIGDSEVKDKEADVTGELMPPIVALLNTRERRGYLAVQRAFERSDLRGRVHTECEGLIIPACFSFWMVKNELPFWGDFAVPLSWSLSPYSQAWVERASGNAGTARQFGFFSDADDAMCRVELLLSGHRADWPPMTETDLDCKNAHRPEVEVDTHVQYEPPNWNFNSPILPSAGPPLFHPARRQP